ncbi:hypothetical protein [Pseudonocardia alni]|uniref:Saccharopine dehydrogenase NADP binding domain-containing protein n=1 Tax=Pseudonocardia alni TaxID=33907 RepID=A0A852WDG8_PSEA5|nr:hypothetical protein [Pseudonocardia antarctica]NYG05411.1 hypothetical protein [Pseudonocardia antarctica]
MNTRPIVDPPLILVIGNGDLATRLLDMLVADVRTRRVVLAGRNRAALELRANLSRFAAKNLGITTSIKVAEIDLENVDRTAETLAELCPDIVFMGASKQSWRVITELPKEVFTKLDEAQLGPWLPMHLTLNHLLMQAVRSSGITTKVVNAAYPDAVGPVLNAVGLAPDIGIGNVANIVPALTYSAAAAAGLAPQEVVVRVIGHHWFSHYAPRFGEASEDTFHLDATTLDGRLIDARSEEILESLTGPFRRLGGVAGQLLTAASAKLVVTAIAADTHDLVHAPAPGGLPGGYPVRVGRDGHVLDLPDGMTLDQAQKINQNGQLADGIEYIDPTDGAVTFAENQMAVMADMLGYSRRTMQLEESADCAAELAAKYAEFAARHR